LIGRNKMKNKKSLSDLRAEILKDKQPFNQIKNESDKTESVENTVEKRSYRKKIDIDITKETVKGMLQTPFIIAKSLTGFDGFNLLMIDDNLVDAGYRVYCDFGIELYNKWINLAVFGLGYGGLLFACYQNYNSDLKKKKEVKDNEQNTISDGQTGKRQDDAGQKTDSTVTQK